MSITITAVSNPIYSNVSNTTIDCMITTIEQGIIPYTAAAHDSMPYGQKLWTDLQNGIYGAIAAYVSPTPSSYQLATQALAALGESDKTMLRIQEAISLGLTTATTNDVIAWVNYRKALRNYAISPSGALPSKPNYPANT